MSHTTGKLAANGDWIGRQPGGIVAIIGGFDDATNEANANRLVACWNANPWVWVIAFRRIEG